MVEFRKLHVECAMAEHPPLIMKFLHLVVREERLERDAADAVDMVLEPMDLLPTTSTQALNSPSLQLMFPKPMLPTHIRHAALLRTLEALSLYLIEPIS